MKQYIIYLRILIVGLIFGRLLFGGITKEPAHDHINKTDAKKMWTCSMHPQIMQPEKGDCPICGMDLIPAERGSNDLSVNQFKLSKNAIALAGIQTLGAANNYPSLVLENIKLDSISYVLDPSIQDGDAIKYVIHTDNGLWTKHDTIIKKFGDEIPVMNLENGDNIANWTSNGWSTTSSEFYSPSSSITESPSGNYQNDVVATIEYNEDIDLTTATVAKVEFYAKWAIESDWDFASFEVSTDGGSSWQQLCGKYTNDGVEQLGWGGQNQGIQPVDEPIYDGAQATWVLEEIDLSDYIGQTINLRFYFESDGGSRDDGFYFDDFKILHDTDTTQSINEQNLVQFNLGLRPFTLI